MKTPRHDPPQATESHFRRRVPALAGAAVLAFFLFAGLAPRDGLATVGAANEAPRPQAAVVPAGDDPIAADLSRFALNALLVPLLDDDAPPRWTDVALPLMCGPATTVEVDGSPLLPGMTIPATAFTVRWSMDRCTPLAYSSVELSGVVELLVFHEDTGMSAVVKADRLTVAGAKGTSRLNSPFAASLSLAGS